MSPSSDAWRNAPLLTTLAGLLVFGVVLAYGANAATRAQADACMACHGPSGQSHDPTVPNLAGQTADYIDMRLQDFKSGRSNSRAMSPIAKGLATSDICPLANYFSAQARMSSADVIEPALVENGSLIADRSQCGTCHERDFTGRGVTPSIAGQQYQYIVKALTSFRSG